MLYSGSYRGSSAGAESLSANETSREKTKRLASALNYYKTAAKLGDAEAENALGIMIEELGDVTYGQDTKTPDDGDGNYQHEGEPIFLGRDPTGAGLWYRRAAFNGNPYALLNLARLYSEGKGVERNVSYAAKLLRQASSAGVVQAELELTQLEKTIARGDSILAGSTSGSGSGSITTSPHRFRLDPSRPEVSVRVITEEERKQNHQSRTPSPTRHVVRDSDTVIVSPPRVAAVLSRGVTTPKRHQSSGETKTKVVGSPYTADAEARLAKLKALLSSH
jgi:hypothetical protein